MTTSLRARAGILSLAAVSALSLAACGGYGSSDSASSSSDKCTDTSAFKVGVVLGLTGSFAQVSESEKKALELYASRVNGAGGIDGRKIELVFEDSTSSESEAVKATQKLISQNVLAVLGTNSSGESIAMKSVAESSKTPLVSLASSDAIVSPIADSTYVYKIFPGSSQILEAQLAYAETQGWTNVAFLGANNAYGQEPLEHLDAMAKEHGLDIVAKESFSPDATDVTAQLTTLASKKPDVVLVWGVSPINAIVAKNAADINFEPTLLNSSGAAAEGYLDAAKKSAEGTLIIGTKMTAPKTLAADDAQYAAIEDFRSAWTKKYSTEPDLYASIGWDGGLLVSDALKDGKVDPCDVPAARTALRDSLDTNIVDVAGANSQYSFSKTVHGPAGTKGLSIIGVENGEFTIIAKAD